MCCVCIYVLKVHEFPELSLEDEERDPDIVVISDILKEKLLWRKRKKSTLIFLSLH